MDNNFDKVISSVLIAISNVMLKMGLSQQTVDKIEIKQTSNGIVLTYPEYFIYIDSGRKKGSRPPSTRVIMRWLDDKRISTPFGMSRRSFAYIIARSIGRDGIRPRPFLDKINSLLQRMLTEHLEALITDKLKQIQNL